MVKALHLCSTTFLLFSLCFPVCRAGEDENSSGLVGSQTTNFNLPSSQDRLINYGQEYYGRYNLIITFFPAAFTPI
ncbi:MAG: hypothetical protein EG828_04620 [Deltaproteobacteria bacterium]|nr:hypothetical protein [Deltaproteobacteria bacterium]